MSELYYRHPRHAPATVPDGLWPSDPSMRIRSQYPPGDAPLFLRIYCY